MKFLIDAQLPRKLIYRLREFGYDSIHTLDLPKGNSTQDNEINDFSVNKKYILVTKDADFVNSFVLIHKPYKLLLVSTGNIKNIELEEIFSRNIKELANLFQSYNFIEIDRNIIIIHS
ncbi:MAG: DUF5615 family PIN-like protein [Desulfobacterales bacterium]|nr:DUF5615 family PIN-like protein [Desulfobacterales bacterium]